MSLNLFENFKKEIQSNETIQNFMDELSELLKDISSFHMQNKYNNIENEPTTSTTENLLDTENTLDERLKENRKEGHLYLVTEDRMGEIYLWDFTDKPKHEFKEVISSEDLLQVAKEGAMLQYKNGKYILYSTDGYNMLFDEEQHK